ncbi:GrpB family protein [Micromonospora sediminicola]|uniref:GrpB family protein n=1 Tax=Micromonospora sediminicola TaxID=946078 RepID=UPI0033A32876
MGDDARPVEVVPYDPSWPARFAAERLLLSDALPTALSIEHIGSTSVPGLMAKPIIDIQAVVPEVDDVLADLAPLRRLGYVHRPLAFPADGDHLFLVKDTAGRRSQHLHVFRVTSGAPEENRLFRAYLTTHPGAARRYEAAKLRAAERHPDSRARYALAKEEEFLRLLTEARLWGRSGDD